MYHSDGRVLAWEGEETEKDMRAHVDMHMCVRVCVCAEHIGLNNCTSKSSLGLATSQKLLPNQTTLCVCTHPFSIA